MSKKIDFISNGRKIVGTLEYPTVSSGITMEAVRATVCLKKKLFQKCTKT